MKSFYGRRFQCQRLCNSIGPWALVFYFLRVKKRRVRERLYTETKKRQDISDVTVLLAWKREVKLRIMPFSTGFSYKAGKNSLLSLR